MEIGLCWLLSPAEKYRENLTGKVYCWLLVLSECRKSDKPM